MKDPITPDMPEFVYLDDEERELINAFENGATVSLEGEELELELKESKEAAENYFNTKKTVTVTLTNEDIYKINEIAAKSKQPADTVMAAVLHRFANG